MTLRPLTFFLALASLLLGSPSAFAVTSKDLVDLYARLAERALDSTRIADATGRVLSRPGLEARFGKGEFRPILRGDGRMVGLLFRGEGTTAFHTPDGKEARRLPGSGEPLPFTAAFLLATDTTLDDLAPTDSFTPASSSPEGAVAASMVDSRNNSLLDPLWERLNPSLEFDVLEDLYGTGYAGGHLLAEFQLTTGGWVSWLHNPRGALHPGESTAVFTHAPQGDGPHDVEVLTSFASSDALATDDGTDLVAVDVDLTARAQGLDRDLSTVALKVEIKVANLSDTPRKALQLLLASGVRRCVGDEDLGVLRVTRLRDYADKEPASLHRRGRLFIALNAPIQKNELEILKLEYGGDLVQPVNTGSGSNVWFTPLGGYPWYPRLIRPDRHAFSATFHTDRFVRGAATGNLVSDVEDPVSKGRVMRYEEKGGVTDAAALFGEYIVFESEPEAGAPRIRLFTTDEGRQTAKSNIEQARATIAVLEKQWGRFPYSSLNLVDLMPMPAGNWAYDARSGLTGNTEGGWTCSPHGDLWAWEGFSHSWAGVLSLNLPATAPTRDYLEANALDKMFVKTPSAVLYLQASALARQWWGQYVFPASYREEWLTEGLVSWSAAQVVRRFKGDAAYGDRLKLWQDLATADKSNTTLVEGETTGRNFTGVGWGRGPAVLTMMEEAIGAAGFISSLQDALNRPARLGLTLTSVLESVAKNSGRDYSGFFNFWARTTALPRVEWQAEARPDAGGAFEVTGSLTVEPVPPGLKIPVVVRLPKKQIRHEMVEITGPETPFVITGLPARPVKIEVDPEGLTLVSAIRQMALDDTSR